jgi:hypothetical protein
MTRGLPSPPRPPTREGAPSRAQKRPSRRQLHVRQCAMGRQVSGRLKCSQHSANMFAVALQQDKTFLISSKTWAGNIPNAQRVACFDRSALRQSMHDLVFSRVGEDASWYGLHRHVLLRLLTTTTFLYEKLFLHWPCYGIYKQATVTCPSSALTIFKSLP